MRLTGSGLGCDDWPNCNDERSIDVSSNHAAIEQVNRLFTGLVAVAVIAAVLGSLWRDPRRRDLTLLSLGLVAGVVGQVVLGGITVLVDLHPLAVQAHMLLSMVLVATAVVLLRRAGEPDDGARRLAVAAGAAGLVWALAGATGVAIVAGTVVTGAGPHAGDEDVQRFDVDIAAAARVHGITVMVALAPGRRARRAACPAHRGDRRRCRAASSSWIFVAVLQAAVGYIAVLQRRAGPARRASTCAGATALWAMTVWLVLSTTPRRRRPRHTEPAIASA